MWKGRWTESVETKEALVKKKEIWTAVCVVKQRGGKEFQKSVRLDVGWGQRLWRMNKCEDKQRKRKTKIQRQQLRNNQGKRQQPRKWDTEAANYGLQEKKAVSGESASAGARPCRGPPAHRGKKHSNKRIIYWRRKEGEAEWRGWKEGEHCTEAFESCVSETLAPSQHSQPMCNILPHAAPLTYSAARAHMVPPW